MIFELKKKKYSALKMPINITREAGCRKMFMIFVEEIKKKKRKFKLHTA